MISGGNFETVAVTCETSWKECVIAVANYLWSEVVSDVVDYLAKEGIIWVLAIAIASTVLIRIKYCKNVRTKNAVFNKQILNKVGYKIQDLELKINVLTYKMQYGTWPLPHQICNLNPKFRKIRMTLSNPGDRNNWLKHVLLNPSSESNVYAPYLKPPRSSVAKLTNCLDVKQECAPHVKHSELSTACSSIETLKSTSDQSVNTYTWRPRTYPQNKSTKEKVSRSKDFTLQRRNVQLLPLNSNAINRQSSKTTPPLTQNSAHATNVKYNPCQKFTETVYECKSFLKELQRKDKRSRSLNRSSEMSKASTLKAAHAAQRSALSTTEERETSRGASAAAKREEINETKFVERIKDNAVEGTSEETYRENKVNHVSNDAVALKTTTHPAPPRELVPIIPIMRPARNMQPSQETLVEVRRTLQGLHDVLQTYQDTTRSPEGRESTDRQIDEADSFITYPIVDISSKYLELKESLSSLAEYSSHTSKMYRCSNENVALRNTCKGISRHDIRRSVRGNPPAKPYLRSCSAMSQTSGNEREECEKDIFDCGRDHVLESSPEANKDAMKTDTPFSARDNISEADRIVYILSPESKDTQDGASLERLATGKFSNTFDEEQYRENVTISQNSSQSKMSIDSNNRQERSTALLLQEALHFKNALLTHSRKRSTR
ncbi:PREDICTED: uncharacterized protein LOC105452459 isoform X2 [Wasmannia auropunctata]|uniref:uncharacterized protein LOC105452459 isoform X2 n=1 Tax=Wasmannia auropunctata TaxID=64793 RepID=UPI0005F09DFD|nr:PREDICTED: uncharacterized protein LOC105452459 isoform X2 [Wasmannia auropunctata]